jgi:hypothetical protein
LNTVGEHAKRARRYGLIGVAAAAALVIFAGNEPSTVVVHTGAAPTAPVHRAAPATPTDPSPVPTSAAPLPDLSAADQLAGDEMDLGVAVLDLTTGQLVSGRNGAKAYYSASLSKLLLVVDMLDRRSAGEITIPDEDLQLIDRALTLSDDEAMDALWDTYDGMGAMGRVAERAGLSETRAPEDPTQWGEVEVSADDMVRLYQYVLTKLAPADRELVVDELSNAEQEAADGFDQFFGLLYNDTHHVYAKQGWMYYFPNDVYLHSAGVVDGHYAVAVLSVQSGVTTETARERLADVTTATLATLPSA